MYFTNNGHIPETLPTQNSTNNIQNSNNLIEVPISSKSDCWLVKFGITCHICHNVWHTKSDFDSHFHREHDGPITYTCTPCGKQVEKYRSYSSHCYRHSAVTKFKCSHCEKCYPLLSRLVTHVNASHMGEPEENEDIIAVRTKREYKRKLFECPECEKKLASVSGLQFHIKMNHQNNHPPATTQHFTCKECGKVSKSLAGFQSHIAVHQSAKQYACNFCDKRFLQAAVLQKHTQIEHTGQEPFSCSLCPLKFKSKSFLNKHMAFHYQEREFPCTVCNKCFKTKRCLKVHSRMHLEATHIVLCPTCGKRFSNSTKLRQHMNTHNEVRPYACKYCTSKFTNFPNWMKHTRRVHKVDHKTGKLLLDLQPDTKTSYQNSNIHKIDALNSEQKDLNMSKENEKEIFDPTNLFDDANQEALTTGEGGILASFSTKKRNSGITCDNNGNYKDEIKMESKNSSLYENSSSINFSNFHKRIKSDGIVPNITISSNGNTENTTKALQDHTEEKIHNNRFTKEKIKSESESMALYKSPLNMDSYLKLKKTIYSDKNLPSDKILLDSKEPTDSVKLYEMQEQSAATVTGSVRKTVSFTNNDIPSVIPLKSESNIPILVTTVATPNHYTLNRNYMIFGQNTFEPQQLDVSDKAQGQAFTNNIFKQEQKFDNKILEQPVLNKNKQEQNMLTDDMTHRKQIVFIYNGLQEKYFDTNVLTQSLANSVLSENNILNNNLSQDQMTTENLLKPIQQCPNHAIIKNIVENEKSVADDNIQGKIFASSNNFPEEQTRNKLQEQILTGNNITEETKQLCNYLQDKHIMNNNMVQVFIRNNQYQNVHEKELNKLNDNLPQEECFLQNNISEALNFNTNNDIYGKPIINNSLNDIELLKNKIVQSHELTTENTDYNIAEVMDVLNQNITDSLQLINNQLPQEQELTNEKNPKEHEFGHTILKDETVVKNKMKHGQEEQKLFENNISHELLNNNIPEKIQNEELEGWGFVKENCLRKPLDVTYTPVNLTSALGLDEGSHLAHINPHLTFKPNNSAKNDVNSPNSQIYLNDNVFIENTFDSLPESLLASGTDTLLMNCKNLRMMTENDPQSSVPYEIDPMDIFNTEKVDLINMDVQDVLDTLENITSVNGNVDGFFDLDSFNKNISSEMSGTSIAFGELQPYISGDFLIVPPSSEL